MARRFQWKPFNFNVNGILPNEFEDDDIIGPNTSPTNLALAGATVMRIILDFVVSNDSLTNAHGLLQYGILLVREELATSTDMNIFGESRDWLLTRQIVSGGIAGEGDLSGQHTDVRIRRKLGNGNNSLRLYRACPSNSQDGVVTSAAGRVLLALP